MPTSASAADDQRAAALGDRREADQQRSAGNADVSTGADLEASAQRSWQDARFPIVERENGRNESNTTIPKKEAPEMLQDSGDIYGPYARNDVADFRNWIGIDPEVDAEISARYPLLASEERRSNVQFVDSD